MADQFEHLHGEMSEAVEVILDMAEYADKEGSDIVGPNYLYVCLLPTLVSRIKR